MTTMLELSCGDPIVCRDGRPFGAAQGNRMRSLGWPLPSVVSGSLRSVLGKAANREFSVATSQDLLQVDVAGVFPVAEGRLYLPAPQDCVVDRAQRAFRAAPQPLEQAGSDWPMDGLLPVGLTEAQAPNDFKPEQAPAWWPAECYAEWLVGDDIAFNDQFLQAPEIEDRTHVQLDPDAGAAEDGNLFTTAALPLSHLRRHGVRAAGTLSSRFAAIALTARVRANAWCGETVAKLDALHPLGGERRLVHWKASAETSAWPCPQPVRAALASAAGIRMVLVTPAVFRDGWRPGWIDKKLIGKPPGTNVTLRLVGVSIQRWRAVSGWSLADLPGQPRGPKPVKRLVPSGGVYFFETVDGKASGLADRWLESVSDDEQDRRDGFGLAVWGRW
jgi:CRISPR-associated protein Cmr3